MMVPRVAVRYGTTVPKLDVSLRDAPTGSLGESGPDVWFRYDSPVVALDDSPKRAHALSVRMPVVAAPYDHLATLVFFDNLLMESDTRSELARLERRDASDVAGLLGAVGAECAGAVSSRPHGAAPETAAYRAMTISEVEATFDERHGERLSQALMESRQVMSGVQRKLVLRRYRGTWHLPLGGAAGTHAVKRSSGRFDGLVANELACLRLFAALGLPVPYAEPIGGAPTWGDGVREPRLLAVERFDRVEYDDERPPSDVAIPTLSRLHQEDLCQATGRRPSAKYQANGGPTLRDLAMTIRRFTMAPATDLQFALTAAIANVCLGNGDAHGKNFALLTAADGSLRLAPFYDIVSTDVYPMLTPTFSMRFGHAERATQLGADDIPRLAKDFGVSQSLVRTTMEQVAAALQASLDDVLGGVERDVGIETPVLHRIRDLALSRVALCERMLVRHPAH
jgi:serine/threonine-protein kinase HipA